MRYANGERIGEILVEQFVGKWEYIEWHEAVHDGFTACRPMGDGTCSIPCYEEENDCNITVVKVFLAKNSDSKDDPPILHKLNPILWHGLLL